MPALAPSPDYDGGARRRDVGRACSPPGERRIVTWQVSTTRDPRLGPPPIATDPTTDPDAEDPSAVHAAWQAETVDIETDHEVVNQVIRRSIDDLCLLRSTDRGRRRVHRGGRAVVRDLVRPRRADDLAPVRRFRAAPGDRDAGDPREAPGPGPRPVARRRAGQDPARVPDRRDDAGPANCRSRRTTARSDSTPLWLILLGETHDWTGDDALVDRLWPQRACRPGLDRRLGRPRWRRLRGVRATRPDRACSNQGWKDSGDAIRWADGTLADDPDRTRRGPGLRLRCQAADRPSRPRTRRVRPRRAPRDRRLRPSSDGSPKRSPCPAATSRWPSTATSARSTRSARTPAIACGAGSSRPGAPPQPSSKGWALPRCRPAGACGRTASDQPGYNPIGYHIGTVWPHDTAIAAAGARRYGFDGVGGRLSGDLLAAAHHFPAYRLPGVVLRLRSRLDRRSGRLPGRVFAAGLGRRRAAHAHPDDARTARGCVARPVDA